MPVTPSDNASGDGAVPAPAAAVESAAARVRLRVLLPLAAAMLLLVLSFVALFVRETGHRQSEDIARTAASVEVMFREQSAEGAQVMRSIMELLLRDRNLEAALRARDRARLLDLSAPLLRQIKHRNRISHFYYILPDRTMLLRVQAPDKHGDKIERFVLREAQRTGKPFWGNEQGPLGSFTLRMVYPWVSDGEVIGYLEMGIEFEDIMQSIKNFLDVNVFVAIDKPFFDRAKWDEAQQRTARPVRWDEFPNVLVLSRTTPLIPAPIVAYLGGLTQQHSKRAFEIAWDAQVAQTIVVPFANLRGQQLGEMVVVRDITAGALERRRVVTGVAFLCVVIGGGLMLFFHGLLGRVQRDAAQAQRVLSAEQFERQRAEHALGAQRERNALLETRGRMMEELAGARETAEAALAANQRITRELRRTQSELLDSARRAGMAEIAANVLHNVGNILNSVNISASLVSGQVRASKAAGIGRVAQMFNEHGADLGDFLTRDPKGRLLPDYVNQLAAALAAERRDIIEELAQLTRKIEHIKDIVATQQSYAGVSRMVEPVQARDLVEDALRMNAGALERHEVTVIREFAEVPVLPLDRHRILQILVNLISNAKQSMDTVAGRAHRMTLRIAITDGAAGRHLSIGVADEGEGIPPDNLTRIFAHGFTTRQNGHGFGLHSCALAARDMGATLTAHSDGIGRGALFTLDLPFPAEQGTP